MIDRRTALRRIGGLAGAASLARFLPGCGDNVDPPGISTYVFMMMENRSYDHYLGARTLLEGKPGDGLPPATTNPDLTGAPIASFHPGRDQLCDLDPPHSWDASRIQWNQGANDGFVIAQEKSHGAGAHDPMQYLTRDELPVTWALADAYTTCDRWFASVLGPTWPNRFYWHTGSSGGLSSNKLPATGYLTWPSVYNRLMDRGVDWAYYYGTIPVIAALNNPGPYQLPADYLDPRVRRFQQFLDDAEAGTLPPVVYIDPAFYENDDHPPAHPINGQELIAAVYGALARSPQWPHCMLVITYDEHGGFYDHVSPPTTADDYAADGFDQLGFRVPAMVIGPYAKQGYVSSVQYDHTSALKHIQNTFGLERLSMRSDAATDLVDCIDLDRLAKGDWAEPIELPTVDVTAWPMADACFGGQGARVVEPDPITAWADANPDRVAGLDLRGELDQYREAIRASLARRGRALAR